MMRRMKNNVIYDEPDKCVEGSSDDESFYRSNDVNSTINSTFDSISSKTSQYHSSDSNISYVQESHKSHYPVGKEKGNSFVRIAILVAVSILVLCTSIIYIIVPKHVDQCSFSQLRARYPNQDSNLWMFLETGIQNILSEKSDKPGVYLFLQASKNESLINDIVVRSSKCFDPNSKPIEMKKDFTTLNAVRDYGYAIEEFKKKIKEGRTILIADLNEISAEAARALHYICDTYSPIVSKVVIFLTLVTHPNVYERGTPVEVAINTLTQLWGSKLKSNELGPLITRVTDQVLLLKNE